MCREEHDIPRSKELKTMVHAYERIKMIDTWRSSLCVHVPFCHLYSFVHLCFSVPLIYICHAPPCTYKSHAIFLFMYTDEDS